MELFAITRHGENKSEITEEQEKEKLERVLKQIERKKQQRNRQREREREKRRLRTKVSDTTDNAEPIERSKEEVEKSEDQDTTTLKTNNIKTNSINLKGFTVLGGEPIVKKSKTERVLPQWLTNPTVISSNLQDLTIKVSKMKNLDKAILQQLKSNGVKYFFPVQAEVIPWLLEVQEHKNIMLPRDVCVSAPTGSGKTLAFVLPIVQALKKYTVRRIRALVILPTQELAEQVYKTFKMYIQGTNIEVGLITGKHLFAAEQKQLQCFSEAFGYVSKIDILVCTAGRLVSHIKMTPGFNLQSLEFLVIDEADRVLENVQDDWLYHLEKHISVENYTVQNRKMLNLCTLQKQRSPQKLLFSATLTQDPEKIEKLSLFQPKLFSATGDVEMTDKATTFTGKFTTPKELTEKYIVCSKVMKPLVLYNFIKREKLTKSLIFAHSLETAHRLKILLQSLFKNKLKIEEISSSLKGKNRDSFISSFVKGDIDLLICTDFLARGIDLPGVECVVSYSAPKYLKTYIHRVGRTARAGESGLAVTLLHNEQLTIFKSLLNQMNKEIEEVKIDEEELEVLSKRYGKALNQLKETVSKEEQVGMKTIISKKKATKKLKKRKVQSTK